MQEVVTENLPFGPQNENKTLLRRTLESSLQMHGHSTWKLPKELSLLKCPDLPCALWMRLTSPNPHPLHDKTAKLEYRVGARG